MSAASAKKIPDKKSFFEKSSSKDISKKKTAETWAKNHVVPTTAVQKKEVPNPKNSVKRMAFNLLVNF